MLGKTTVRILGALLIIWALFVLSRLLNHEVRDLVVSMPAFVTRYLGMLLAGLGFLLLRKWGLYVYLAFIVIQWILYFAVYGGQGAQGSLWLGLLGPIIVATVAGLNWRHLK
jgi:hypothetical protein